MVVNTYMNNQSSTINDLFYKYHIFFLFSLDKQQGAKEELRITKVKSRKKKEVLYCNEFLMNLDNYKSC